MVSEIDPPKAQTQVAPATSTGMPPAVICGASGVHGAGTTGTQGIGVSTPERRRGRGGHRRVRQRLAHAERCDVRARARCR